MNKFFAFLRNWTLPISMLCGALSYLVYSRLSLPVSVHAVTAKTVAVVQPLLIFTMLLLSFCKVDPRSLRFRSWHAWLLLIQVGFYALLGALLLLFPAMKARVVVEGAMICMICPTATAAVVVTDKLGGNTASLTTYTILCNFVAAVMVPLLLPVVHPVAGMTFLPSFWIILKKVFPLLILPFFLAWAVRVLFPAAHKKIIAVKDLAFLPCGP